MTTVPLRTIAHARSGDKGRNANIGVIPYTHAGYVYLKMFLDHPQVHSFFSRLGPTKTTRYDLPSIEAFNFVIEGILGEGGSQSLRIDAQGKALAMALLEMPIDVPQQDLDAMRKPEKELAQ